MIHNSVNDILKSFDYLIELLQDAGIDNTIVTMIEDAKDLLLEEINDNSYDDSPQ
jgi:hypothetical protein